MKKLFTMALGMAFLVGVKAQPKTILVNGSVAFASTTKGEKKDVGFGLLPAIGYQFDKHWTAGIQFDFEGGKQTTDGVKTSKNTGFGVAPYIRYTWPISSIFAIYLEGKSGFLNKKFEGLSPNEKRFFINVSPSVYMDIKNGFGLNLSFGGVEYNTMTPVGSTLKTKRLLMDFGQGASFGISKNFGTKKK